MECVPRSIPNGKPTGKFDQYVIFFLFLIVAAPPPFPRRPLLSLLPHSLRFFGGVVWGVAHHLLLLHNIHDVRLILTERERGKILETPSGGTLLLFVWGRGLQPNVAVPFYSILVVPFVGGGGVGWGSGCRRHGFFFTLLSPRLLPGRVLFYAS